MVKVIPKRANQGINGLGVSFVGMFLLIIGLPVVSAVIIDVAIYAGGDTLNEEFALEDDPYNIPQWQTSGSASDMIRCDYDQLVPLVLAIADSCAIFPFHNNRTMYMDGHLWNTLPGCLNYSSLFPPSYVPSNRPQWECGNSDFKMFMNVSHMFKQGRTMHTFDFEFRAHRQILCNLSAVGPSSLDYTLHVIQWIGAGTMPIETDNLTFKGHAEFNSGGFEKWHDTDMCTPTISFKHQIGYYGLAGMKALSDNLSQPDNRGIFLWIEIDNLETESGRAWDFVDYENPFVERYNETSLMRFTGITSAVEPVNAVLETLTLFFGLGIWTIAAAMTPFWNPIKSRWMK